MAMMLITMQERNARTGRMETIVSHGVDLDTDKTVITDSETIEVWKTRGAVFDTNMGEWVYRDRAKAEA